MKRALLYALGISLLLAGCGKGDDQPQPRGDDAVKSAVEDAPVTEVRASSIVGKVSFKGDAPPPRKVNLSADPYCATHHPKDKPLMIQEVDVNANHTLRNVFVYVKDGLGNRRFAAPRQAVVLDQVQCMYLPRVLGVQVGQPLEIRNSDDTLHNVHCAAKVNLPFNDAQPLRGMKKVHQFDRAEVMVFFKCDVHPWMGAYVGVLPHPYFSVTGEDGAFSLKNLPAGEYTIEAWHEKYGTQTQTVRVSEGQLQTIEFTFEAK